MSARGNNFQSPFLIYKKDIFIYSSNETDAAHQGAVQKYRFKYNQKQMYFLNFHNLIIF